MKAILRGNKEKKECYKYCSGIEQIFLRNIVFKYIICVLVKLNLFNSPSYNQSAIPLKIIPSFPEDVSRNELLFISG